MYIYTYIIYVRTYQLDARFLEDRIFNQLLKQTSWITDYIVRQTFILCKFCADMNAPDGIEVLQEDRFSSYRLQVGNIRGLQGHIHVRADDRGHLAGDWRAVFGSAARIHAKFSASQIYTAPSLDLQRLPMTASTALSRPHLRAEQPLSSDYSQSLSALSYADRRFRPRGRRQLCSLPIWRPLSAHYAAASSPLRAASRG